MDNPFKKYYENVDGSAMINRYREAGLVEGRGETMTLTPARFKFITFFICGPGLGNLASMQNLHDDYLEEKYDEQGSEELQ